MGSNHSKVLHAIEIATYDDSDMRKYLVDLVNTDPESFEDCIDEDMDSVRPYGPIREIVTELPTFGYHHGVN